MRMKCKEQGKAIKKCPDTGRANLQSHGISGRKMHLATVRRHSGEAMLHLHSIRGPLRLQDGTKMMILERMIHNTYEYKYIHILLSVCLLLSSKTSSHGFFAFAYSGEDILLGTNFLSLVAPFAFFPDGFSYTIRNPLDGTTITHN